MNDAEVKLTLNQVQRYETCKALLEGRLSLQNRCGKWVTFPL
jgi:hypothetical protein